MTPRRLSLGATALQKGFALHVPDSARALLKSGKVLAFAHFFSFPEDPAASPCRTPGIGVCIPHPDRPGPMWLYNAAAILEHAPKPAPRALLELAQGDEAPSAWAVRTAWRIAKAETPQDGRQDIALFVLPSGFALGLNDPYDDLGPGRYADLEACTDPESLFELFPDSERRPGLGPAFGSLILEPEAESSAHAAARLAAKAAALFPEWQRAFCLDDRWPWNGRAPFAPPSAETLSKLLGHHDRP